MSHAHSHDHDHAAEHSELPSEPALRVKALESLLVEKGLVDPAALDAIIEAYERKIGPRNGAHRGFDTPRDRQPGTFSTRWGVL